MLISKNILLPKLTEKENSPWGRNWCWTAENQRKQAPSQCSLLRFTEGSGAWDDFTPKSRKLTLWTLTWIFSPVFLSLCTCHFLSQDFSIHHPVHEQSPPKSHFPQQCQPGHHTLMLSSLGPSAHVRAPADKLWDPVPVNVVWELVRAPSQTVWVRIHIPIRTPRDLCAQQGLRGSGFKIWTPFSQHLWLSPTKACLPLPGTLRGVVASLVASHFPLDREFCAGRNLFALGAFALRALMPGRACCAVDEWMNEWVSEWMSEKHWGNALSLYCWSSGPLWGWAWHHRQSKKQLKQNPPDGQMITGAREMQQSARSSVKGRDWQS